MRSPATILGPNLPNLPWANRPRGGADTVTGLAFGPVDEVIWFLKANAEVAP